ncbi:MAG: polyphosphate kinase 1 [Pseudomonadota bacterium]
MTQNRNHSNIDDTNLRDPGYYTNRELSWLAFNRRVMELAHDPMVPPLERLRFLCICSANLDEFFEVRVAGLQQQVALDVAQPGPDGLSPQEQLRGISELAHGIVKEQYQTLNEEVLPDLEQAGVRFLRRNEWTEKQVAWVRGYFFNEVIPVVSPLGLDPAHPFPRLISKSLNFVVTLDGVDPFGRDINVAVLQAPRVLPRIIRLPEEVATGDDDFVFLSSVIHAYVDELFPGMEVTGFHQFRVTRNTDLFVEEEEIDDLLSAIKGELPQRNFGQAVRLEVADTCPEDVIAYLLAKFKLDQGDLFQVKGPVNLSRLAGVLDQIDRPELKYPTFKPSMPRALSGETPIFDAIRHGDIWLHHPYQSFLPVIEMIRQAARDPKVLAIKQTLYRTGSASPMVDALMEAARAGKEVTVVIELRARFDEEANVSLADKLHHAGCQVVYGMVGYKTHAKLAMVVRRERKALVRYAHLGTGNYHAGTARAYTDYGLLTRDAEITEDVHKVFMQITGAGQVGEFNQLLVSPNNLHISMIDRIKREAANARAGKPARIAARMNSLIEASVIEELYRASQAGVQIDLVIRGMCSLRPGIPGVSDTIRVRSILGRFLEHSRVFYFENAGDSEMYLSSADWMPRNLYRRVETAFPVKDPAQQRQILTESIDNYFRDNYHAWALQADGSYLSVRAHQGEPLFSAQNQLLIEYEAQ